MRRGNPAAGRALLPVPDPNRGGVTLSRSQRARQARETVEIVDRGEYATPGGRVVRIADAVGRCLAATRLAEPDELARLRDTALSRPATFPATAIEVRNETTLAGAARAVADTDGRPVGVLNFASAKNPGGGFLNGSQAQEESLARSSALHASLLRAPAYYEEHRASASCLYSDRMIISPDCPVFRDDDGSLREEPFAVTFLTSPAPNAGAAAANHPADLPAIPATLGRRAELVLALAGSAGCDTLVLGAWGCGVFRNDPAMVARAFADLLAPGRPWHGRFRRVLFSVLDTSAEQATFAAFAALTGGT
jgi:uncharacterized protein (TIGR02452 family)